VNSLHATSRLEHPAKGGGSRLSRIVDTLKRQDADILVLSEYRGGPSAPRLCAALHALGYRHATTLVPPPNRNGVLVAARCPFREHGAVDMGLPEPYRMVSVDFATFRLSGVYMPNLLAKVPYWEALIAALSSHSATHALAIGDFNTCRAYLDEVGAIDATAHYMDAIEQIGFRDLWRHGIPMAANLPGSAPGVTGSGSTTPFCHTIWPLAPASSAIPTRSGSLASPITRRWSWSWRSDQVLLAQLGQSAGLTGAGLVSR
jgi:hypothetical protein